MTFEDGMNLSVPFSALFFWGGKVMWIQNWQAITAVSWSGPSVLCLLAIYKDLQTVQQNPWFLDMSQHVQIEIHKKIENRILTFLMVMVIYCSTTGFVFDPFFWFTIWIFCRCTKSLSWIRGSGYQRMAHLRAARIHVCFSAWVRSELEPDWSLCSKALLADDYIFFLIAVYPH